jgi:hypothetical protein
LSSGDSAIRFGCLWQLAALNRRRRGQTITLKKFAPFKKSVEGIDSSASNRQAVARLEIQRCRVGDGGRAAPPNAPALSI